MGLPKISLVVLTYNRSKKLALLLESITEQTIPKKDFEVIVVDDGSIDDTPEVVNNFKGKFNLRYKHQKNSGVAVARNTGLEFSKGKLVSFLADDYVLPKNYCEQMVSNFSNKNVMIVKPLLIISKGTFAQQIALFYYNFYIWESLKEKKVSQKFFFSINYLEKLQEFFKFTAPSGGATFRRNLLKKSFLFDSNFRKGEDTELGYRLFQKNIKIHFDPRIKVEHLHRSSIGALIKTYFYYGRGEFFISKKHKHFHDKRFFREFIRIPFNVMEKARATCSFRNFAVYLPFLIILDLANLIGFHYEKFMN